jgi:hypothetical protein
MHCSLLQTLTGRKKLKFNKQSQAEDVTIAEDYGAQTTSHLKASWNDGFTEGINPSPLGNIEF